MPKLKVVSSFVVRILLWGGA